MTLSPRLRLINVAIGLSAAALLSFLWAKQIPIRDGKATIYSFTNTLGLYSEQLTYLLILTALCAWALTGILALIRLCRRNSKPPF